MMMAAIAAGPGCESDDDNESGTESGAESDPTQTEAPITVLGESDVNGSSYADEFWRGWVDGAGQSASCPAFERDGVWYYPFAVDGGGEDTVWECTVGGEGRHVFVLVASIQFNGDGESFTCDDFGATAEAYGTAVCDHELWFNDDPTYRDAAFTASGPCEAIEVAGEAPFGLPAGTLDPAMGHTMMLVGENIEAGVHEIQTLGSLCVPPSTEPGYTTTSTYRLTVE